MVSSTHLGPKTRLSCYSPTVAGLLMLGALSDERTGLSFTIAAGPRQRSYSRVWDPRESWPHFTDSDSRLLQPGGPGPRIYIPQEQGDPVISPGTGFPFRRLLRLAGLRWKYSNPPSHGLDEARISFTLYLTGNRLHLHNNGQPINVIYGNNRCLWWEAYGTQWMVRNEEFLSIKSGRLCSYHCILTVNCFHNKCDLP
jgi:hypothetical protein